MRLHIVCSLNYITPSSTITMQIQENPAWLHGITEWFLLKNLYCLEFSACMAAQHVTDHQRKVSYIP